MALNKLAEREKVLYVAGISGSNDTTGKDCVRYGFRQNFYGETAADAIGPVLVKQFGKNKKAAFMTPDYTYGHTVTKSVNDYLTEKGGWTMVTNQVSPLGAPDFSSYLLNIANSGADVLINVNWGRDAVLSIQQAKKFGIFDEDEAGDSVPDSFLAPEVGGGLLAGVYAATDFWWTLEDKYPLAKMFVEAFEKKFGYKPEWGAENSYMQLRASGPAWSKRPAASIRRTSSRPTRKARRFPSPSAMCTSARKTINRSSGHHRQGQGAQGHEEQGRLLGGRRSPSGRGADAGAGCVRLQARRLHLIAFSRTAAAKTRRRARGFDSA